MIAISAARAAEPYTPTDDQEVLESLPVALFARRDEIAEFRAQMAANPADAGVAAAAARRFMQLGSETGDARFYGYARAALLPWWKSPNPPSDILRLRAKLNERNHDYDLALADLRLLLQHDSQDVQGWIETANIHRVKGDYAQALKACDELNSFAGTFATAIARLPIMAATGQADEAYRQLAQLLPEARANYSTTVQWFVTMQAEIAQAMGRDDLAETHLREALRDAPDDRYLLRAYGELLLEHGRALEALQVSEGHENDDGLLLTAALAARELGRYVDADRWRAQLAVRFQEVRQRGDQPLGRFEARYVLLLEKNPQRALALALENWRVQKEVHDTRTVLEAAIAAGDFAAAQPVIDFLENHGARHAALDPLVEQLRGQR